MIKTEENIYPVYTKASVCTDCYKCVRNCPVKSIRIENGAASVIGDQCVACGKCVTVCPSKAKCIRNDVIKVKELIKSKKRIYVSLAPSWVGLFSNFKKNVIIHAIKNLGFTAVSETALGAEAVSQALSNEIEINKEQKLYISSCCPSIVDYIRYYLTEFTPYITSLASPAITHAKILKDMYGEDIAVVFIGPCVAKKNESDKHKDLIDYAITFNDLYDWLEEEDIDLYSIDENIDEHFVPRDSFEGALYPIEGGMNETLRRSNIPQYVQLMTVSGLDNFKDALTGLNPLNIKNPIFIEALACSGGCINGPAYMRKSIVSSISSVMNYTNLRENEKRSPEAIVNIDYRENPIYDKEITSEDIVRAMERVGKYSIEDELNCAGCGYNSCRDLAIALIKGNAEPSMCVSYMRKNAMKKANAVLRSMPSGVVIVDTNLKIVEVNEAFHEMFKSSLSKSVANRMDAMIGFNVERFLPCGDLFLGVFKHKKDVHKERYQIGKEFYSITIFPIDNFVGAIVENVTDNTLRQDEIRKKAQEVIQKNITTVQEIASLLGEHIVDTEVILSSIAGEEDNALGNKEGSSNA